MRSSDENSPAEPDDDLEQTAEEDPNGRPFEFDDFLTPNLVREALFIALFAVLRSYVPPSQQSLNDPDAIDAWVSQWQEFKPAVHELCSYLGIEVLPARTFAELVIEFSRIGFDPKRAETIAATYLKLKRGASVTVRTRAVEALELHLTDPGCWTWPALGIRFCDINSPTHQHDKGCSERLRQAVIALERVLKKHGVSPRASL